MKMSTARRPIVAILACLASAGAATPALANSGGAPNPNSCGVGQAEAHAFIKDPTLPGASEITQFPPVAFGCTGNSK